MQEMNQQSIYKDPKRRKLAEPPLNQLETRTVTDRPLWSLSRCNKLLPIHGSRAVDRLTIQNPLLLQLRWNVNMKKCIDASPLVMKTGSKTIMYPKTLMSILRYRFIGSHAKIFSAIDCNDGKILWTTNVEDRIESSATTNVTGSHLFVGKQA
jgi:hypothetical protein